MALSLSAIALIVAGNHVVVTFRTSSARSVCRRWEVTP